MKDPHSDILTYLEEDIGYGDITTEALRIKGLCGSGTIKVNQACIVAGLLEASEIFEKFNVSLEKLSEDGKWVEKGTIIARVTGDLAGIITAERLALNMIMQMSGIATKTRRMVDIARRTNPKITIAATRKTTPGFRRYQKKAVVLGGGDPHRIRLDDMFLIKENHICAVGTIDEAVKRAKESHFSKKIEVEAETLEQALQACRSGADIVMLDNFTLDQARIAHTAIREKNPNVLIELSGGMNENTIEGYAPYADIISVGALTHSFSSTDISLLIYPD